MKTHGASLFAHLAKCAALLALSACAHVPDPQATVVLKEAQQVEVPVAAHRDPPVEWLSPMNLVAPDITAGTGDYCISRDDMRLLISDLRAAAERMAQWRAWAGEP